MGKGVLFIVAASIMAGSLLLHQSTRSAFEADAVQSGQQAKVLAREIARSAYNAASAKARDLDAQDKQPEDIVAALGSPIAPTTGAYQGGDYEYWAELVQGSTYRIGARGVYMDASYVINSARTMTGLLEVPDETTGPCATGCNVKVTFEQSQAGYCSAIYLQRLIPKNNNGHGNNVDGVDSSNPGGSKEGEDTNPNDDDEIIKNLKSRYFVMEPELVFEPGNNRNGASALHETTLNPGEQMNFILAVDADFDCEQRGDSVAFGSSFYEYTRYALTTGTENFEALQEGKWAITEQDPSVPTRWRIAFEDLSASHFNDRQLEDIKINGYPDRNNDGYPESPSDSYWDGSTYGGQGWKYNSGGTYIEFIKDLHNYGNLPDFSDQVFYVELITASSPS